MFSDAQLDGVAVFDRDLNVESNDMSTVSTAGIALDFDQDGGVE